MTPARFVRKTARIVIAAFAATSAGVIASSVVPLLALQLPMVNLLLPPKPMLVFSLTFAMLIGVPFFLIAASQRPLGLGSYVGYSVGMSVLVMMVLTFALIHLNSSSGAKFYDAIWILLTEAIPGGIAAGFVAHSAMTVGTTYEDRFDGIPAAAGEPQP